MAGTVTHDDSGLSFSVDDRRYRILSSVRLDGKGQLPLTLALYQGPGDRCLHQDEANITTAKGRKAFAQGCLGFDAAVIMADLLELDAALRAAIAHEAQAQTAEAPKGKAHPRCGQVEEGEDGYSRVQVDRQGTEIHTRLSSFIIEPDVRIVVDGFEAIRGRLRSAKGVVSGITFERHHFHSRGQFLKVLGLLDHWCIASDNEIQCIQAILAEKVVRRKDGTRALGARGNLWISDDGVLDATGWMADPPVLYVPLGGTSPLAGRLHYRGVKMEATSAVLAAFYGRVWDLHAQSVIGPMVGWFFATAFKPQLHQRLGHFPILNCWGTKGAGKTSLLQLFWRLFGIISSLLSVTETEFALLTLLSSTTSIPLVFDEFKPFDMRSDQVRRFERMVRRVYQGEVEHRGRPDLTLVSFQLIAPIAVAGEVPLATQPALAERIIAVSPAPQWLVEHSEARDAFRALTALPLHAFAGQYIPWVLQRDFDDDVARAEAIFQEAFGDRTLPERVRDNLLVVLFGLCQFEAFGHDHGLPVPEQLDFEAMLDPVIAQVCGPDGTTRSAIDGFLEHLATMVELGRLRYDVHVAKTSEGWLALRLDPCLAEFRRYVRDTALNCEVLDKAAYLEQLRQNLAARGYIKGVSELAYFEGQRKRAVLIDLDHAGMTGLDLGGFARPQTPPL